MHKNNTITTKEFQKYHRWMKRQTVNQTIFYDVNGRKTKDREEFVWRVGDQSVRDKFLAKSIKQLEDLKQLHKKWDVL